MKLLPSSPHEVRLLLAAGALGGILFLVGDFLFYGTLGAGAITVTPVMASYTNSRLIWGGVMAPAATLLYLLGTLGLYFALRPSNLLLAKLTGLGWALLFITGASYHAVYTVLGFAARPDTGSPQVLLAVRSLLSALYNFELLGGILGTLALVIGLLKGGAALPRWLVLLTPTLWALLDLLPQQVPAPLGAIINGGWINGWFMAFFVVATLTLELKRLLPHSNG